MNCYLMTMDAVPNKVRIHTYLSCSTEAVFRQNYDRALQITADAAKSAAEQFGVRLFASIMLVTGPLDKESAEIVIAACKTVDDMPERLNINWHGMTTWGWIVSEREKEDATLMELH